MKVLIYGNRKQDSDIYDVSTPEKEAATYLKLFQYLDEKWQVYCDLPTNQKDRYAKAKFGDADAAKRLLNARCDYEYEEFHFGTVIDPLAI
jgi:hypothetical protein